MVINHLEKLFVTSDASTIVTEMDVYHPAAKLLVMAAKAQAGEVGDGTNLVGSSCCLEHRPAAALADQHLSNISLQHLLGLFQQSRSTRLLACVLSA